jgi:hypothetical protein
MGTNGSQKVPTKPKNAIKKHQYRTKVQKNKGEFWASCGYFAGQQTYF